MVPFLGHSHITDREVVGIMQRMELYVGAVEVVGLLRVMELMDIRGL